MEVLLFVPKVCETCGAYLEDNRYFATNIGKAVSQGVGYCSVECWEEKEGKR